MKRWKILPSLTYDIVEYRKLSGSHVYLNKQGSVGLKGLYRNGVIWVRDCNFLSILHELIHHFFAIFGNWSGSTRLFLDFLDTTFDTLWHFCRFKTCRKGQVWDMVFIVKLSWNDFIDFICCRDVGI